MHEYYKCEPCRLRGAEIYRLVSGYGAAENIQHCAYGWEKDAAGYDFSVVSISWISRLYLNEK